MRSSISGLVCALALVLGACSPTVDYEGPVQIARTSTVTLVEITNSGVGGVTPETSYGAKSIEAALPGFSTESIQTAEETTTEWALGAFNSDGFQVLQIFKGGNGKVRAVHGVTHHLQGPNGERIGNTFYEVGLSRNECRVGRNLWRGMAICKAKNAPNVELVFAIPQFQGPFDELAPDIALQDATLQRIVWTARG
ncbi:DUF1131 family protein [Roseibium sp.]|uniref:DUF1131 family protein n=1 Tax=Roseibium sp. TaxID=1936156 RepID=UPI003A9701A8